MYLVVLPEINTALHVFRACMYVIIRPNSSHGNATGRNCTEPELVLNSRQGT